MKILIATSNTPFVEGGHLIIAKQLLKAIRDYGHQAELTLTPQNRFSKIFSAYIATRLIDVREDGNGDKIDKLITFRYPAYALNHPNHTLWLNHRMREYYDLWNNFKKNLTKKAQVKENVKRKFIHLMDKYFLNKVNEIYVLSKNIQNRLKKWGKIDSKILYPPPPDRNYRTDSYNNSILCVSRLVKHKRVDLIIKSAQHIEKQITVNIAGDGPELNNLIELSKNINVCDRINFLGRISDEQLVKEYSKCGAVFYSPLFEDYGFVTTEAFISSKPVITTTDSGGVQELVNISGGGIISLPSITSIAEAINKLFSSKKTMEEIGNRGKKWISKLNWEHTVKILLQNN